MARNFFEPANLSINEYRRARALESPDLNLLTVPPFGLQFALRKPP